MPRSHSPVDFEDRAYEAWVAECAAEGLDPHDPATFEKLVLDTWAFTPVDLQGIPETTLEF